MFRSTAALLFLIVYVLAQYEIEGEAQKPLKISGEANEERAQESLDSVPNQKLHDEQPNTAAEDNSLDSYALPKEQPKVADESTANFGEPEKVETSTEAPKDEYPTSPTPETTTVEATTEAIAEPKVEKDEYPTSPTATETTTTEEIKETTTVANIEKDAYPTAPSKAEEYSDKPKSSESSSSESKESTEEVNHTAEGSGSSESDEHGIEGSGDKSAEKEEISGSGLTPPTETKESYETASLARSSPSPPTSSEIREAKLQPYDSDSIEAEGSGHAEEAHLTEKPSVSSVEVERNGDPHKPSESSHVSSELPIDDAPSKEGNAAHIRKGRSIDENNDDGDYILEDEDVETTTADSSQRRHRTKEPPRRIDSTLKLLPPPPEEKESGTATVKHQIAVPSAESEDPNPLIVLTAVDVSTEEEEDEDDEEPTTTTSTTTTTTTTTTTAPETTTITRRKKHRRVHKKVKKPESQEAFPKPGPLPFLEKEEKTEVKETVHKLVGPEEELESLRGFRVQGKEESRESTGRGLRVKTTTEAQEITTTTTEKPTEPTTEEPIETTTIISTTEEILSDDEKTKIGLTVTEKNDLDEEDEKKLDVEEQSDNDVDTAPEDSSAEETGNSGELIPLDNPETTSTIESSPSTQEETATILTTVGSPRGVRIPFTSTSTAPIPNRGHRTEESTVEPAPSTPRGTRIEPIVVVRPPLTQEFTSEQSTNLNTVRKTKKVHKLKTKRVRVVRRGRKRLDVPSASGPAVGGALDESKAVQAKETTTTTWEYPTAPGERTAAPGVTLAPEASKSVEENLLNREEPFVANKELMEELTEALTQVTQVTWSSEEHQVEPSGYNGYESAQPPSPPEPAPEQTSSSISDIEFHANVSEPEETAGYEGIPHAQPLPSQADSPQPAALDLSSSVKIVKKQEGEEQVRNWKPYVFDCTNEEDDKGPLCKEWAQGGLCELHKPTMFLFCRKTCLCTGPYAQ